MDMIVNNPDKPWNWRFLAQNPNLDIDLIISTKDNYLDQCWRSISRNHMEEGKERWVEKKVKNTLVRRQVSYRILCNKLDKDICELIVTNIR